MTLTESGRTTANATERSTLNLALLYLTRSVEDDGHSRCSDITPVIGSKPSPAKPYFGPFSQASCNANHAKSAGTPKLKLTTTTTNGSWTFDGYARRTMKMRTTGTRRS